MELHPHVFGLVFGLSPRVRYRRWIVTLNAFIDDSGSSPDSKLFVLAGCVSTAELWSGFSDQWQAACAEPPVISDFKMSAAWRVSGEYWRSIEPEKRAEARDQKLAILANLIQQNAQFLISAAVPWRTYESIVRGKVPAEIDSPYFFLFWRLIQKLSDIQRGMQAPEKVTFVFDYQSKLGTNTASWYDFLLETMDEHDKAILTSSPRFEHDKDLLPLKAADMWAWWYRREVEVMAGDRSLRAAHEGHPARNILFDCLKVQMVLDHDYLSKVAKTATSAAG